MFGPIGLPELVVIFLVILLLFGANALPEIARGLAKAVKTFKREANEFKESLDDDQPNQESSKISDATITVKDTSNDFKAVSGKRDWRPASDEDQKPTSG